MTTNRRPKGAHLVGSVPLGDVETVFKTVSSGLGQHLVRMPDGELGTRSVWIAWQYSILARLPGFEEVPPTPEAYVQRPRLKALPGMKVSQSDLGPLGYAESAINSFDVFRRLKSAGEVPGHMRFQVGLPSPLEPVIGMFTPESQEVIGPAYQGQLLGELEQILDAIPHDQLAIQWEVVYPLGVLEGEWTVYLSDPERNIPSTMASLVDRIPEGAQTGFHLCYGDSGHRHFKQPLDTGIMVSVINRVVERANRPINWVHMPVPRDRKDQEYFAPLRNMNLPEATSLYLGLIHFTDGESGTLERIRAAFQVVDACGVATECGLGRRPPDTIPEILRIHQAVAEPL